MTTRPTEIGLRQASAGWDAYADMCQYERSLGSGVGQASEAIDRFFGEYRFLSNFAPVRVELDGMVFKSVESAYQAAKCHRRADRAVYVDAGPGKAKRLGRRIEDIRPDWDQVRVATMEGLLRQKFAEEPYRGRLLATDDRVLIEGNTWGDHFWGVCDGLGENNLGRLLMAIRDDLRASGAPPDEQSGPS